MRRLTLAVLMTCHNRRETTLRCLAALESQKALDLYFTQTYLVDDGSIDGTGESVRQKYPNIKVIEGDGSLFWNGGMHLAFKKAIQHGYDYYLWLNDDTFLYPEAIKKLINTSNQLISTGIEKSIIIGSTQDEKTKDLSYGGMLKGSAIHPLKYKAVEPGEEAKQCETMNGNCVLIPKRIVELVGNLDESFRHSTGDIDYGLRVQKQGGSVWLAPGYIGTCSYNAIRHQAWDESGLTLRERWNKINQPRGLPVQEWKVFSRRHGGLFWYFYWISPYIRLTLKHILKFKN